MTLLTGLTESGVEVPVQVDATGRLVAEGLPGPAGPAGPTGDPGPQGIAGVAGPAGPAGPAGATGEAGPPGPAGTNGTNGTDGTNGVGVPAGGTSGQVLAKNSGTDYDTAWVTPSSGGGAASGPRVWAYRSTNLGITGGSTILLTFDVEVYDTANCWNGSRFTPNVAGAYVVRGVSGANNNGLCGTRLYKNGALQFNMVTSNAGSSIDQPWTGIVLLNGSTDYVEVFQWASTNGTITGTSARCWIQIEWLRSL